MGSEKNPSLLPLPSSMLGVAWDKASAFAAGQTLLLSSDEFIFFILAQSIPLIELAASAFQRLAAI